MTFCFKVIDSIPFLSLFNVHGNFYITNRTIHDWLEIPDLFLVLSLVSSSTLEINLVFLRTRVLVSIYCAIQMN